MFGTPRILQNLSVWGTERRLFLGVHTGPGGLSEKRAAIGANITPSTLMASFGVKTNHIPEGLCVYGTDKFEELFALHPDTRHVVSMRSIEVPVHRYQQSFMNTPAFDAEYHKNKSYMYAADGQCRTGPIPELFRPFYDWVLAQDSRYNQCSISWYEEGDYIAQHCDCQNGMIDDATICIVSLFDTPDATRCMTFCKRGEHNTTDTVVLSHGIAITMTRQMQDTVLHGVSKEGAGRRISMSFRQMA